MAGPGQTAGTGARGPLAAAQRRSARRGQPCSVLCLGFFLGRRGRPGAGTRTIQYRRPFLPPPFQRRTLVDRRSPACLRVTIWVMHAATPSPRCPDAELLATLGRAVAQATRGPCLARSGSPASPRRHRARERETTHSRFMSRAEVGKIVPGPWPKAVTMQVERGIGNSFGARRGSKTLSKPYGDVGTSGKQIHGQRKTIQVSLDHFSGHCLRSERDQIVSKCCQ